MEEPMEDSTTGGVIAPQPLPDDRKSKMSILRPGSMVMMTITNEDYETQYWPKLEAAINQLLTRMPGEYIPISYEQIYSCVYKCVCKQFSERLYSDLMNYMTAHLERNGLDLQQASSIDMRSYIEKFHYAMKQYLTALEGIVPVFNYMNRFYVATKLKTDLGTELRGLFVTLIAERHVPILIPLLVEASSKPFLVSPPVMSSLINNLHSLKPEFAQLRPQLFARYIPSILPPCTEQDLNNYIEETRQMQRDLRTHPEYISGDQSRKRPTEDEPPRTTPLLYPRNPSS